MMAAKKQAKEHRLRLQAVTAWQDPDNPEESWLSFDGRDGESVFAEVQCGEDAFCEKHPGKRFRATLVLEELP